MHAETHTHTHTHAHTHQRTHDLGPWHWTVGGSNPPEWIFYYKIYTEVVVIDKSKYLTPAPRQRQTKASQYSQKYIFVINRFLHLSYESRKSVALIPCNSIAFVARLLRNVRQLPKFAHQPGCCSVATVWLPSPIRQTHSWSCCMVEVVDLTVIMTRCRCINLYDGDIERSCSQSYTFNAGTAIYTEQNRAELYFVFNILWHADGIWETTYA